jgi:hypothetical protein
MFWYLATPYSKYVPGIEAAFIEASKQAALLTRAGVPVFSPIAHTHPVAHYGNLDPLDHSIWLEADRTFMEAARGIIVCRMDGWAESYGVKFEIDAFERMGKPVVHMIPGFVPSDVRPRQRQVIGLCGYAGAGKDEAAKGLVDPADFMRWARVSFADPLREALLALNPVVHCSDMKGESYWRLSDLISEWDWDHAKRRSDARELLQRLGTEVGRDIIDPNCWVNIARRKIESLPAGTNVVITDCRFPNELDMIRSLGGKLIYIERPGVGPVNGHVSDAGLEKLRDAADSVIVNNGTVAELQATLRAAATGESQRIVEPAST